MMGKTLIVISLCLLILVGNSPSANAMSDAAKQRYLDWVSTMLNDGVAEVFLAIAPNGCSSAYAARIKARGKFQALRRCKNRCGETCVIKDHNGKSAFIKQRGSSASSSTSTSGSSSSSSTSASTTSSGTKYDPAIELEYWELVKDSSDLDLLQSYLDEYPNGKFAPLARLKIKKLKN